MASEPVEGLRIFLSGNQVKVAQQQGGKARV